MENEVYWATPLSVLGTRYSFGNYEGEEKKAGPEEQKPNVFWRALSCLFCCGCCRWKGGRAKKPSCARRKGCYGVCCCTPCPCTDKPKAKGYCACCSWVRAGCQGCCNLRDWWCGSGRGEGPSFGPGADHQIVRFYVPFVA